MMKIDILKKSELKPSVQDMVSKLFRQLDEDRPQIKLNEVLDENNQVIFVYCVERDVIIGMASMAIYSVVSGKKGWIEDVVVNKNARGKGIGRKLMNKLIEEGKERNLSEILLFTEDRRKSAISLYSDLGFRVSDSRIYVLNME